MYNYCSYGWQETAKIQFNNENHAFHYEVIIPELLIIIIIIIIMSNIIIALVVIMEGISLLFSLLLLALFDAYWLVQLFSGLHC